MTRLTTRDASILASFVQYDNLSQSKRLKLLTDAGDEAKHIGRVLLGLEEPRSRDVEEIVDAIKNWVGGNRQHHLKSLVYRRRRSGHPSNSTLREPI